MAISHSKKLLAAVFSRNYRQHLQEAASKETDTIFRAKKPWQSAFEIVKVRGKCKIYFAPAGDDSSNLIEYEADIQKIILKPSQNSVEVQDLLKLTTDSTSAEGLWDGEVRTLYRVSNCNKLNKPFPFTELVKISNDEPLHENYGRSYALVYER